MKRIALAVAVMVVAGLVLAGTIDKAYAKEYKIGYVDLAKVFDDYKKTKDSEKDLAAKGQVKEADRKKMVDDLRKLPKLRARSREIIMRYLYQCWHHYQYRTNQ